MITHGETWLDREEVSYTARGAQVRRGVTYLGNTDFLVTVRAGIPDTYFSIPAGARVRGAYVRGYVTMRDDGLTFHPYKIQGR